jgi:hypothetical protein
MTPAVQSAWEIPATYFQCDFLLRLFFDPEDGVIYSFETSVDFQRITRRYTPEGNPTQDMLQGGRLRAFVYTGSRERRERRERCSM